MTGGPPTQRELMLLRRKLFNNIMPTRDEKRSLASRKGSVRPAAAILSLVCGDQEKLLFHVFNL
jgi:hypothetical protein